MDKSWFLLLFFVVALVCTVVIVKDTPIVYTSYSTKKCIKVEGNPQYSCSNLPTRYERVWVK